jgi:hypothetical protein
MGWASRQQAAREMPPMARQRWMCVALRWCFGRSRVVRGAGMAHSGLGTASSWRPFSLACLRQAFFLGRESRARAGRASRSSRAASAQEVHV